MRWWRHDKAIYSIAASKGSSGVTVQHQANDPHTKPLLRDELDEELNKVTGSVPTTDGHQRHMKQRRKGAAFGSPLAFEALKSQ